MLLQDLRSKLLSQRSRAYALKYPILPHVPAVQSVAQLSALTRLELLSHYNHGDKSLSLAELACLRSASLRDIDVSLLQVTNVGAGLLCKSCAIVSGQYTSRAWHVIGFKLNSGCGLQARAVATTQHCCDTLSGMHDSNHHKFIAVLHPCMK